MTVAGSLISALSVGCSKSEEEALAIDLSRQASTAAQESGYKMQQEGEAVLHVYTWSDYISPDVLASFEKALNCKVKIDTFDSNETMYAKLKAGGAGYDIIMPSSYLVSLMAKEGLITKFDHARIPNVRKNFDKNFSLPN
jgi:spermidine/putrescine-binding protein